MLHCRAPIKKVVFIGDLGVVCDVVGPKICTLRAVITVNSSELLNIILVLVQNDDCSLKGVALKI